MSCLIMNLDPLAALATGAPADVCLECKDCGCVILDAEIYTISEKEELK